MPHNMITSKRPSGVVPNSTKTRLSSKTTSAFLNLPGEVKNDIYKHLLVQDELRIGSSDEDYDFGNIDLYPHVLRICRTVKDDAIHLLYGSNKFTFPSLLACINFMNNLAYDKVTMIEKVCLSTPQPKWRSGSGLPDVRQMIMEDKFTFHFDNHVKSCTLPRLTSLSLFEVELVSGPMTLDTTPNAYHKWVAETGLLELPSQLQKRLEGQGQIIELMDEQREDLGDWYSADTAVVCELRRCVQINNRRSRDPLNG